MKKAERNIRVAAAATLMIVVLSGLLCKSYRGPWQAFINDFGPASVAYVTAWMLLGLLLFPDQRWIPGIGVVVLAGTMLIEFSQLLHPAWLQSVRGIPILRIVLGTTFSWWDFPAYLVGAVAGTALLRWLCRTAAAT